MNKLTTHPLKQNWFTCMAASKWWNQYMAEWEKSGGFHCRDPFIPLRKSSEPFEYYPWPGGKIKISQEAVLAVMQQHDPVRFKSLVEQATAAT